MATSTDAHRVAVDESVLTIAVEEALSNACKYQCPQTRLTMLAELDSLPNGSTALHVQLRNTNRAGLPVLSNEDCERVFQAGYKVHTVSAMSDGVGLDTVAQAVRAANGRAWLVPSGIQTSASCVVARIKIC